MMGLNRRGTVTDCIEPHLKPDSVTTKYNPDEPVAITSERLCAHRILTGEVDAQNIIGIFSGHNKTKKALAGPCWLCYSDPEQGGSDTLPSHCGRKAFQTEIRDIPSPLRTGPFAKSTAAKTAISGAVRPNVEVAMFILLAVIIPVVAFFGIKWLVFRPTRLTIHPAGGAFMRVPRGRRRYVFFGPRLPHDPSRNRGSRPRRQRTVVVIRDLESGLHGGSAVHSHADGGGTSNASTTAISGSVCSCSHDHHHGHDGGSEHYITTPDDRELNIKRARTAFGHIATADPRTGAIRAPRFVPDDVSSANASTISADGGIGVCAQGQ
ncbi:hypothetical protein DBV05_g88 [Lasiodiplodia theobromae]|uniref:Uncharacterized protein n=1 Tax=Lasiodiplodia theobromae TaxID=45133 RepID=A0A5N5DYC3_9PEZI|nr:hypothetical protein DBV05_g88 [Lasiodiplodia theobromae]